MVPSLEKENYGIVIAIQQGNHASHVIENQATM